MSSSIKNYNHCKLRYQMIFIKYNYGLAQWMLEKEESERNEVLLHGNLTANRMSVRMI